MLNNLLNTYNGVVATDHRAKKKYLVFRATVLKTLGRFFIKTPTKNKRAPLVAHLRKRSRVKVKPFNCYNQILVENF